MKQKIKGLVDRVDGCYIPRYDMYQMDSETLQKFVELVVHECVDICDSKSNEICVTRLATYDFNIKSILAHGESTAEYISNEIKSRFGIKDEPETK